MRIASAPRALTLLLACRPSLAAIATRSPRHQFFQGGNPQAQLELCCV